MQHAAAQRYAQALFDLAKEKGLADEVESGLVKVKDALIAKPDAAKTLRSGRGSVADKHAACETLAAGAHPLVLNLLKLLVDRGRGEQLRAVLLSYFERAEEAGGVLRVSIDTATEMDADERARFVDGLAQRTGRKIVPTWRVMPELIGGLRLLVGSVLLDGSIRRRLDDLKARMKAAV